MSPLENYLVQAYLNDDLDEAEESAFELLLIERPDLAELVEADVALHLGLAETAAQQPESNQDSASASDTTSADVVELRPSRERSGGPFWLAAAASVALAIGLGAGGLLRSPADMQPATLAYIDKMRDVSITPTIPLAESGSVVLMVPVASAEPCTATVSLRQANAAGLSTDAVPDELSNASVVIPRDQIQLGEATVAVSCDGKVLGEYPIQFVERR